MSKNKTLKRILLGVGVYYSTILSTILIIGGFYTARSGKEIISNFLFLPIVIFLWITLIHKRMENKRIKKTKFRK